MTKLLTLVPVITALLTPAPVRATTGPDESRLKPATVNVVHIVKREFPEVPSIGGWRPDRIPDHPSGRAIDIMVNNNTALGDRIYARLKSRQAELGIRYILWRVANHHNHLHVCVN